MQMHKEQNDETRLTSARILPNSLLYVRPSSWCFKYLVCVHRGRVCPGSVGTRQALLQGWLLCGGFVCLANVPDLVCRVKQFVLPVSLSRLRIPFYCQNNHALSDGNQSVAFQGKPVCLYF